MAVGAAVGVTVVGAAVGVTVVGVAGGATVVGGDGDLAGPTITDTAITPVIATTTATTIAPITVTTAIGAGITATTGGIMGGVIAVGDTAIGGAGRHQKIRNFTSLKTDDFKRSARRSCPGPLFSYPKDRRSLCCNTEALLAWSAATLSRQGV
jgi:hypothetical protein